MESFRRRRRELLGHSRGSQLSYSCRGRITMVQPANSRESLNLCYTARTNGNAAACWSVLSEAQVRSVFVVVAHVHQPFLGRWFRTITRPMRIRNSP